MGMNQDYERMIDRQNKQKNRRFGISPSTIIKIIIVLFVIIIISTYNSVKQNLYHVDIISTVCHDDIEEVSHLANPITSNGFYTYCILGNPEIEIHAAFYNGETSINDAVSRYYKYYFENWEDEYKDKFVVVETYENCSYMFITKKNWILNYATYIEVDSYEEMLEATEAIIRFMDYMGNSNIITKSYIKVGDSYMLPHNASPISYDEIRKRAIEQYSEIVDEGKILFTEDNLYSIT